ncbi:hypothetical protein SDC9_169317 [bioreactor metagenome]|uniref:Uncharacterized protein n=1 Tax=bioreactor metagenome TaxID=1076179 RepID=A0A645G5L0_9ZZZZ
MDLPAELQVLFFRTLSARWPDEMGLLTENSPVFNRISDKLIDLIGAD